jgi:hypothetical protein
MDRRVNKELLNKWIQAHSPNGISRLAVESQVSADTIKRARATGMAPKKPITRQLLSQAMDLHVDVLFPPVTAGEEAS